MVVVHNIVQSPTKMVTINNYYNTLARELTEEDQKLIDITNILDIEPFEGVFLASRVVETYFKEKFSNSIIKILIDINLANGTCPWMRKSTQRRRPGHYRKC